MHIPGNHFTVFCLSSPGNLPYQQNVAAKIRNATVRRTVAAMERCGRRNGCPVFAGSIARPPPLQLEPTTPLPSWASPPVCPCMKEEEAPFGSELVVNTTVTPSIPHPWVHRPPCIKWITPLAGGWPHPSSPHHPALALGGPCTTGKAGSFVPSPPITTSIIHQSCDRGQRGRFFLCTQTHVCPVSARSDGRGGGFAQRRHSANYYVAFSGNTPENHPPTEACMVHSKQHGVHNSGPWDPWQASD